jgi:hypothetical protein
MVLEKNYRNYYIDLLHAVLPDNFWDQHVDELLVEYLTFNNLITYYDFNNHNLDLPNAQTFEVSFTQQCVPSSLLHNIL